MSEAEIGGSANQDANSSDAGGDTTQQQAPNLGAIRKAGQREVLDVLSKVTGQKFSGTNDAASFIESIIKAQNQQTGGTAEPTHQKDTTSGNKSNSEMKELRQMIQQLQSTIAEKDQVVRKTTIQSQIKEVAVRSGFDPQYLDLSTGLFESQLGFDDDGSYYVKSKDGGVRLDNDGQPYSLDKLAQEILKSRPKLAVEEPRTGTGTKFNFSATAPGGEMPDAATNPEGWKAWKQANGVGAKGTSKVGVNMVRRSLG